MKGIISFSALIALAASVTLAWAVIPDASTQAPNSEYTRYQWPAEQQRQLEEAVAKRDRSLLPTCTEDYFEWRETALLSDEPQSMSFWDNPGCVGREGKGYRGPKGAPSSDFQYPDKFFLGLRTDSETTSDKGVYHQGDIHDVGVNHSSTADFFAARALVEGTNNHSLEAGWYEGEWSGNTRHIYVQDSHTCSGSPLVCTWIEQDDECNIGRGIVQIAIDPDNSTDWTASCWDGTAWNVMYYSEVNLGDDDADFIEVLGEVKDELPGTEINLYGGVGFAGIELWDGTSWNDWDTSISTHIDDSDGIGYDVEFDHNYYQFAMVNECFMC